MPQDKEVSVTFKTSDLEILQALLKDLLDTEYHNSVRDEDIEVGGDIRRLHNIITNAL